jgi:hypothetical protein
MPRKRSISCSAGGNKEKEIWTNDMQPSDKERPEIVPFFADPVGHKMLFGLDQIGQYLGDAVTTITNC